MFRTGRFAVCFVLGFGAVHGFALAQYKLTLTEKVKELFRVWETNGEIERGISFLSDLNYLGANIYPLRFTGTYRGQEHPSAAPN